MLTFKQLINKVKNTNIYLLFGNGTKNQFRYITDIKKILKKILVNIPQKSSFIYFGDSANKKKPDIGYAFELLSKIRPDINIYMIQIKEAKAYGVPIFVKDIYWHNDYTKKCKWGGLYQGKPCSNTKKWISLHKYAKIKKGFILGGGQITIDEMKLLKKLDIDFDYFPIERRYLGDGETKINDNHSKKEKIGITYKF